MSLVSLSSLHFLVSLSLGLNEPHDYGFDSSNHSDISRNGQYGKDQGYHDWNYNSVICLIFTILNLDLSCFD